MLEAAHQRREEGLDVVIGYVVTAQTPETKKLITGLEIVSSKQIDYHNGIQLEMDVDAVIARQPALALVDDLAHTNAPGSRHPKRYQDVLELLNAGIEVYTTLNIQNVESLNDIVEQITGARERETIPDKIIDNAGASRPADGKRLSACRVEISNDGWIHASMRQSPIGALMGCVVDGPELVVKLDVE